MAFRIAVWTSCVLAFSPALAAEPVRIGVTTILSGQYADRGQSEQYGVELALERINEAGGVLGRPVEALYGDNAADPATGIAATKRLIEEQQLQQNQILEQQELFSKEQKLRFEEAQKASSPRPLSSFQVKKHFWMQIPHLSRDPSKSHT